MRRGTLRGRVATFSLRLGAHMRGWPVVGGVVSVPLSSALPAPQGRPRDWRLSQRASGI